MEFPTTKKNLYRASQPNSTTFCAMRNTPSLPFPIGFCEKFTGCPFEMRKYSTGELSFCPTVARSNFAN